MTWEIKVPIQRHREGQRSVEGHTEGSDISTCHVVNMDPSSSPLVVTKWRKKPPSQPLLLEGLSWATDGRPEVQEPQMPGGRKSQGQAPGIY